LESGSFVQTDQPQGVDLKGAPFRLLMAAPAQRAVEEPKAREAIRAHFRIGTEYWQENRTWGLVDSNVSPPVPADSDKEKTKEPAPKRKKTEQ